METFKDIISSSTPTLVDFFATWCGPCKAMSPVMDQLKEQMGGAVRIIKIDVDKNTTVANQFQIRGVPTFILFKDGEVKWRQSGGMSLAQLVDKIKSYQ